MTPTQEIVKAYRKAQGNGKPLPLREFAEKLSEPLAILKMSISYGSIQHWESGRYAPDTVRLRLLARYAKPHTWQWYFVGDLMAAKFPTVYQPVGEIGKQVLGMEDHEHAPESN